MWFDDLINVFADDTEISVGNEFARVETYESDEFAHGSAKLSWREIFEAK